MVLSQGMTRPFWIAEREEQVKYGPEAMENNENDHKIDTTSEDTKSGSGAA